MYQLNTYTELEIGHRLMSSYAEKCRNLHGHKYCVDICVESANLNADGMVIDFKRLKEIVKQQLDDPWDHAFTLHEKDPLTPAILRDEATVRFHVLPENPTLEYMVKLWYGDLKEALIQLHEKHPEAIAEGARLKYIKASETTKNTCTYSED